MNKSESKRPLGNNSFAALRQSGAVYVDKTAFVQQIADSNPPLMLTRPRHFGKSMLVSALEELFLHGTAPYDGHDSYFKGLAIEQWHDRPPFHSPYYVLRLDFAALNAGCATVAQFRQNLIAAIVEFCRTHELSLDEALPDWLHEAQPNLGHVLRKLFKAVPHNSLVLLVDDYDAPVLAHADDEKELEACKPLLLCLFVSIKCHYDKCRCVFFTGTTRYVDLDPLGGGHNFMNDSQEEYLATCCGFTRSELKHYFESQLQHALALRIGCLPQSVRADQIEALLDELESHYGGYSFDGCPEHKVFAPEPVLRFLAHPEVQNWPNPCVEEGLGAPQLLKVALARVNMRRLLEQFNDGEFKVNGLDVWRASVHNQEVDALAFFFALGLGCILSVLYVFFGDVRHLYSVLLTLWMYLSALFYPLELLPEGMQALIRQNPIYSFIAAARDCILYGRMPGADVWARMALWSLGVFLAGAWIFRGSQNRIVQKL